MPQLRLARRHAEINVALVARLENITARSRALLKAAAALETVLEDMTPPRHARIPVTGASDGAAV